MKSNLNIILAIVFLALAALACQAVTGGGNNTAVPPADTAIVPVIPMTPAFLLRIRRVQRRRVQAMFSSVIIFLGAVGNRDRY